MRRAEGESRVAGFAVFGRSPSAPGDLGELGVRAIASAHVGRVDLGGCWFIPAVSWAEGVFA